MKKLFITSAIVASSFAVVGCSPTSKIIEVKDKTITVEADSKQTTSANYKAYSAENVPEDAPYIVFFHADWCPTCVQWEKRILGEDWDENVVILKADYDTEKELKDLYGITKQSTAVFIDAEGKAVKTMSDPKNEVVEAFFAEFEAEEQAEDAEVDVEVTADAEETVSLEIPVLGDVEATAVVVTDEGTTAETVEIETVSSAVYKAYSLDAVPTGQKYSIYFHASWCPSCVAFNKEIEAEIGTLPAGTIVLKADYDKEAALKKEYGVTSQHTLVTFNADGSVAAVKQGAGLDDITAFFQ